MSEPLPPKVTGTLCNTPVEAGLVAYPCTLGQGHTESGEPHFAVEVARSVRAWRAWRAKQDTAPGPHEHVWAPSSVADDTAVCKVANCAVTMSIATMAGADIEVIADPAMPSDRIEVRSEPTKVRDGDQRLPVGGKECVQDLVIAAMQESKRVGTERYGSPLMTFNGRKGIQDVQEEARDLFVYLTQVAREAEADRETLIEVVAEVLTETWLDRSARQVEDSPQGHSRVLAEVAVDRVMGWVAGQQVSRNG